MMTKLKGSYASAQIRAGARGRRVTGARPTPIRLPERLRARCRLKRPIVPWLRHNQRPVLSSGRRLMNLGVPINGPAPASNNSRKGIKRTANRFEYVRRAASRNQDINQSHLIRRLSQSPTVVRPSFGAEDKSFFCRTGSTLSTRGEVQFVGVLQSKFAAGISNGDEEIQQRERRWTRFTIC